MFHKLFKKQKARKKVIGKGRLNKELIYQILEDNTCFIIEKKSKETISKLKFDDFIFSIICLDNKDIIFEQMKKILIYRIIQGKYCFIQEIDNEKGDYPDQEIITFYGCTGNDKYKKGYEFYKIHIISGNRFILCSNYGLKFYGPNEESKKYENIYTYSWNYKNIQSIKSIEEINPDKFSVKAEILVAISMLGPEHFEDETYLVSINEIKKGEEEEEEEEEKDYNNETNKPENDNNNKEELDEEMKKYLEGFLAF